MLTWRYISFSLASLCKLAFMQSLSCENNFDLHKNEPAGKTHFNINGFLIVGIKTKRSKDNFKFRYL